MEKYKPDELETLIQIIKYDKARGKTYSDVVKMELSWQRMQNLGFVIKTNHKWLNDILVANKDKTLEEIINLVKAQGGAADDVQVSQGNGVEAAGIDGYFHGVNPRFYGIQ